MSEMRVADERYGIEAGPASVHDLLPPPSQWVPSGRIIRAVDQLPDTVCLFGPDGEVNHVSGAVRELLGREPWSFAGTSAIVAVHPADRERATSWFRELRDGVAGAPDTILLQLQAESGDWVTVEASGRAIGHLAPHEVLCSLKRTDIDRSTGRARTRNRRVSDGAADPVVDRGRFAQEIQRLEPDAPGRPLVIFVDIDDYENLRLAYGDEAAHSVVQQVRGLLSSLVRLDDVIGELEEGSLAVLFRDVPDDEVRKLLRRVTRGLRHPVPTSAGRIRVSASVGSARPSARPACGRPVPPSGPLGAVRSISAV